MCAIQELEVCLCVCVCVEVYTLSVQASPKPLVINPNISGRLKHSINLSSEPISDKKHQGQMCKEESTATTTNLFSVSLLTARTITVYLTKGFKLSLPTFSSLDTTVWQKKPRHV